MNEVNTTTDLDRLKVIEKVLVREGNITNLPAKAREKRLTLSCELGPDNRYNITRYSRFHGNNHARLAPDQNERIINACVQAGVQQGETTLTRVGGGAYTAAITEDNPHPHGKQVIFWEIGGTVNFDMVNTETTVNGIMHRGQAFAYRGSASGEVNYGDLIRVNDLNVIMEVTDGYRQTHHGETPLSVWKGLQDAQ